MDKLSQIRVLYVEDDEFIREELSETLEFDVKELIVAEDGEEGLQKFKEFNPDLVVSDVKMPKMNGLDMSFQIKKLSPKTPIIITTAFSDSEYLMKAIEIGVDRYVTKPVDIDKLYSAMEELSTILLYEKEKETQNRYLRYILDFNPNFILIATNQNVEYINQTFLKFLGFKSFDEFVEKKQHIDELVESIQDINGNHYSTQDWIKTIINNPNIQHIIHFKHNIQSPFIVLQNYFKDLDKDIVLFSDVTNLELNRLSLNDEILKLKEDNKEKLNLLKIQSKQALMGEMISAIAHQWKQPLNAIGLNVQLIDLDDEVEKEELEFCIDNTKKQVDYMAKTIDDFRNFFSPNKRISKVVLKEVIDEVMGLFSKQLEVHNIKIDIDIKDISVFGYKNELSQILMNFIKNSKDAFDEIKKENRYIKITAKEIENSVELMVEDNAGGIKKEILDRIFEPYFTSKKTGTGIGLYISKMLVEDMQGTISVESYDDVTIFTIKLMKG